MFEPSDGKILVYECATPDNCVLLSPGVSYHFELFVEPNTQRLFMAVEGGDLAKKILFDIIATVPPLSELTTIAFGRSTFYCADGTCSLYIDNLFIDCSCYVVNETAINTEGLCVHNFKAKGIVDNDHPASEAWKKYTCKECGCWYYGH
jgi:hypothetical protein